jgi:hypothetical protein
MEGRRLEFRLNIMTNENVNMTGPAPRTSAGADTELMDISEGGVATGRGWDGRTSVA